MIAIRYRASPAGQIVASRYLGLAATAFYGSALTKRSKETPIFHYMVINESKTYLSGVRTDREPHADGALWRKFRRKTPQPVSLGILKSAPSFPTGQQKKSSKREREKEVTDMEMSKQLLYPSHSPGGWRQRDMLCGEFRINLSLVDSANRTVVDR